MVETWRDSWFEEGVRVFYVVPPKSVDEILPLTVSPAPTRVERVFVGRMDVVTPFIQQAVTAAIALDDRPTLERYGRFLGSITDRIMARNPGAIDSAAVSLTNAALRSYLTRATICE
jgi:hypothetical protein